MKGCLFLIIFFSCSHLLYADTIYLRDGTSVKGWISEEGPEFLTIREPVNPAVTKITTYPKSEIIRIVKEELVETPKPIEKPAKKEKKVKVLEKTESQEKENKPPQNQTQESTKAVIPQKEAMPLTSANVTQEDRIPSLQYEVAMRKDRSFVGFIRMKRIEVTIVLPAPIKKDELKLLFAKVLKDELGLNPDLDALWITVFTRYAYVSGVPLVYAIWSPAGGWDDFANKSNKSRYKWDYRFITR